MTDEYNQFRFLYSLYIKFQNYQPGWHDIDTILREEHLRYIPKNLIFADILYLDGDNRIEIRTFGNRQQVRIKNSGIQIVNTVMRDYPQYLARLSDEQSRYEYNNISAIIDENAKIVQTYYYITHRQQIFKNYLNYSSIFTQDHIKVRSREIYIENLSDIVTDLIDTIFNLNELSKSKFGFKIFKDDSKLLNDLRKKGNDEEWFTLLIARIAAIIDNVYYDDIRQVLTRTPKPGSINLIEEFLISKNITYDKASLDRLRILHRLRSTKRPIHNGEQTSIQILNDLGISYPVADWQYAGKVCLNQLLSSIKDIVTDIRL